MNNIRELRKAKGVSQSMLAREIGVAQNTVSQWECGTREPDNDMLAALASYFNTTVDYLLGREDSPNVPYDPDTVAAMEEAFERPEMRALFSVSKNATKEDIEKTIAILKAIKGNDDYAE